MNTTHRTLKKRDIDKIIEKNPTIDRSSFIKTQKELRKFKEDGFTKTGFSLVIPYSQNVSSMPD